MAVKGRQKKLARIAPNLNLSMHDLYGCCYFVCKQHTNDGKLSNLIAKCLESKLRDLISESVVDDAVSSSRVESIPSAGSSAGGDGGKEDALRKEILDILQKNIRNNQLSPSDQLRFITELNKLEDNYKTKTVDPVINITVVVYDQPAGAVE